MCHSDRTSRGTIKNEILDFFSQLMSKSNILVTGAFRMYRYDVIEFLVNFTLSLAAIFDFEKGNL